MTASPSPSTASRLIVSFAEHYTLGQVLGLFTLLTLVVGGGSLYLMRATTPASQAVAFSFFSVLSVVLLVVLLALAFWGLFVTAAIKEELRDFGALAVVVGLLEILAFLVMTYRVFTVVPTPSWVQRQRSVAAILAPAMKALPEKLSDILTLNKILYRGHVVVLFYNFDLKSGQSVEQGTLQQIAKIKTCNELAALFKTQAIDYVVHDFFVNGTLKQSLRISNADCAGAVP